MKSHRAWAACDLTGLNSLHPITLTWKYIILIVYGHMLGAPNDFFLWNNCMSIHLSFLPAPDILSCLKLGFLQNNISHIWLYLTMCIAVMFG